MPTKSAKKSARSEKPKIPARDLAVFVPKTNLANPKIDDQFEDVFLLAYKAEGKTKRGDPYYTIELKNPTGKVSARIWSDKVEQFRSIECGAVLYMQGRFKKGYPEGAPPEAEIVGDPKVVEGDHPLRKYLNDSCPVPLELLVAEFQETLGLIRNPGIRHFLDCFFSDPQGAPTERFFYAPAAVHNHHNYLSGLLEHTLEVKNIALSIAAQPRIAPRVHFDCLMGGVLVHDSGKLVEYEWEGVPIGISHEGKLDSHMVFGANMLKAVWEKHGDSCRELGMTLAHYQMMDHIIASHHGKLEWGATKEPSSVEALIAHQADMASAHVRKAVAFVEAGIPDDKGWVMGDRTFPRGLLTLPAEPGPVLLALRRD